MWRHLWSTENPGDAAKSHLSKTIIIIIIMMNTSVHVFFYFSIFAVLTLSLILGRSVGAAHHHQQRSIQESAQQRANDASASSSYLIRCGTRQCDLRRQYCDTVINTCARCDNDCHYYAKKQLLLFLPERNFSFTIVLIAL